MHIGVYGLGRFGSFWASLCTKIGTVYAYNRNERPCPPGVLPVDLAGLARCDVIFLCCAISAMPAVCEELAKVVKSDALIIDTCSVKLWPVEQMCKAFPASINLIGSHPMFGPDSARGGVNGLPIVLCPVRAPADMFDSWSQIFANLGLHIITMTPDEHDREAASTQGITHFMGRLFAELSLKPSEIATLGYQKLQEVMEQTCNDPWQLFADLQHYNPHTARMRENIRAALDRLTLRLTDNSLR